MLISVALSVEEYTQLQKLAQFRANMDAETLLRCITGDLVDSNYTGGSDERMYAHQWLDRRFPEWLAEEFEADRRKQRKAAKRPLLRVPDPDGDYFDQITAGKGFVE